MLHRHEGQVHNAQSSPAPKTPDNFDELMKVLEEFDRAERDPRHTPQTIEIHSNAAQSALKRFFGEKPDHSSISSTPEITTKADAIISPPPLPDDIEVGPAQKPLGPAHDISRHDQLMEEKDRLEIALGGLRRRLLPDMMIGYDRARENLDRIIQLSNDAQVVPMDDEQKAAILERVGQAKKTVQREIYKITKELNKFPEAKKIMDRLSQINPEYFNLKSDQENIGSKAA